MDELACEPLPREGRGLWSCSLFAGGGEPGEAPRRAKGRLPNAEVQREAKEDAGQGSVGRQFLQLYANVKRSRAYHGLSCYARAILFELIDRHTGINNGMIGLGVREAAYELDCSQSTVSKAMRELDDSGLARPLTPGVWRGKRATEWRLMWLRCEKTGDLPVSNWEQRDPHSEFAHSTHKFAWWSTRRSLSSSGGAQTPNSSMNDSAEFAWWCTYRYLPGGTAFGWGH